MNFVVEENKIFLMDDENEVKAYVVFPHVKDNIVEVTTTYVSESLRGQKIAHKLMELMYEELKCTNRVALIKCSYAAKWFENNQDKQDIISK